MLGRPSLVDERTAEILDAFERCVARFGIEGSSLERIAEEAGMRRSILRHYVGNREDLVAALAERVVEKYRASFESHIERHSKLRPVEQLMGYLFPPRVVSTAQTLLVVESLIAVSANSPDIQNKMRGYVEYFVDRSAGLLQQAFPHAAKKDCWSVAYGVISICFNHESLAPLDPPPKYARAAQATARALVQTLGEKKE